MNHLFLFYCQEFITSAKGLKEVAQEAFRTMDDGKIMQALKNMSTVPKNDIYLKGQFCVDVTDEHDISKVKGTMNEKDSAVEMRTLKKKPLGQLIVQLLT